MRKVLIIGPEFFDYNRSVADAFNCLGFSTKVLGYMPNTVKSITEKIKYHFSKEKTIFFDRIIAEFNDELLTVYNDYKPDIVFVIHGGVLFSETMHAIKCKKILWMMDSISREPEVSELSPFMTTLDYVFFFEETDVDFFKRKTGLRSWFLPLAVDTNVYYPMEKQKDIDILFVGALYENRIQLLSRLSQEFRDRKIKVYGNYYSPLRKPVYHFFRKNRKIFTNKNIRPEEVNKLYNRAKICLNIHHPQSRLSVNPRFFEISGSKAFQLVDRKSYICDNFHQDEIMTYIDETDMLEKIHFALSNAELREQMATRAYMKTITSHTFIHRIKTVLDIVNK